MRTNPAMDNMEYLYENVVNGSVKDTNKLTHVLDKATSTFGTDIDNQQACARQQ